MGFNIEIRDKNDLIVDWPRLDKEVCELWCIEQDAEHWAVPPPKEQRPCRRSDGRNIPVSL